MSGDKNGARPGTPTVVIWAPSHNEQDRRVNRVIEVLVRLKASTTVVYDSAYAGKTGTDAGRGATVVRLAGNGGGFVAALLGLRKWLRSINETPDLLYIHDAGLYGLILAALASRHRRGIRMVFDYHDWIPWEIWYQWNKLVRRPRLVRALTRVTQDWLLPCLGRSLAFRGIVGITPGQVEGLRKIVPAAERVPAIAVPNTRNCLPDSGRKDFPGPLTLVWVGNVAEGRDLDRLLLYTEALRRDEPGLEFSLLVVGKVLSERMLGRLNMVRYVRHVPGFSGDGHLRDIVTQGRPVGVFLGWDDVGETGINEIASPNKIYSYVNIGIPVIFARSLEAVEKVIPAPAGRSIADYADFRLAVVAMSAEYAGSLDAVRLLRANLMWDDEAQSSLASFLAQQLGCDSRRPVPSPRAGATISHEKDN